MGYPMTSEQGVFWQTAIAGVSALLTLCAIVAAIWVGLEPRRVADRLRRERDERGAQLVSMLLKPVVDVIAEVLASTNSDVSFGAPPADVLKSARIVTERALDRCGNFDALWQQLGAQQVVAFADAVDLLRKILHDIETCAGEHRGKGLAFNQMVASVASMKAHAASLEEKIASMHRR